jgi:ABC-type Fe3+-hydroxamate transport system substrate-binding protein
MPVCVSRTSEDDLGRSVRLPATASTIVSLVPSLTEAIAASAPGRLIGATDWCSHPADLTVERIGGTKNPDIDAIVALAPDLVIANEEENRAVDIDALGQRGLSVWVTAPTTVSDALASLERMLVDAIGVDRPGWLSVAAVIWSAPVAGRRLRAVVPIWRRPWMVLGRDTFAGDLLAHLGIDNVMADSTERYPSANLEQLRELEPDLVVLPDEPYAFGPNDGPEVFAGWDVPVACVSGRHLTWYGPSLVDARDVLLDQLAQAAPPPHST